MLFDLMAQHHRFLGRSFCAAFADHGAAQSGTDEIVGVVRNSQRIRPIWSVNNAYWCKIHEQAARACRRCRCLFPLIVDYSETFARHLIH